MPIPAKNASVSLGNRRRSGQGPPQLAEAQPLAQLGQHQLVGFGPFGDQLIRHRFTCEQGVGAFASHRHRPRQRLPLHLVGLTSDGEFDSGLKLFPNPGNGPPHGWPHVGERGCDRARVGHRGDLGAEHLLQVQPGHPIGDVRRWQEGRHPIAKPDSEHLVDGIPLEQQVGVGHLHTLGVSRCAGRVDEGDNVLGLYGTPRRLEVEEVAGGGRVQIRQRERAGGAPSTQTMCSMGTPLARTRSTYCCSQMTTLVPALSNT